MPRFRQCRGSVVITNESATDLGLMEGREAMALVKSSFVMLSRAEEHPRISTPSQIPGTVADRTDGGVNSAVAVDIGDGKTLVSVISRSGTDELGLKAGVRGVAFFNTSQVILAVD